MPYLIFYCIQVFFSRIGKGNNFVDGSIGMNPTQRMQKHVKLTGIIAYDNQVLLDTMFNDAADQYAFSGDLYMSIFDNTVFG